MQFKAFHYFAFTSFLGRSKDIISPGALVMEVTNKLLNFLSASPSPYHAVAQVKRQLLSAGFIQLYEQDTWQKSAFAKGGRYFFTRNGTSLIAFTVGAKFNGDSSKSAVSIIATHTDSPCLKVKPRSEKKIKEGWLQVAVETYGGGIWHTWFDRDLSIAGRIICKEMSKDGRNCLVERLVDLKKPILRIPTLAIHLDSSVREAFKFNTELHLAPILATAVFDSEKRMEDSTLSCEKEWTIISYPQELSMHTHAALRDAMMSKDVASKSEIIAADLCLYDTQPAGLYGIYDEFVVSARLDNLFDTFCAVQALEDSTKSIENDSNVRMIALFDNEEVGSESAQGAQAPFIETTLRRILTIFNADDKFYDIIARSFLLSADMAHAVHPNYPEKHEDLHRPLIHGGIVLKYNGNQRYATSSRSASLIKVIAAKRNVPIQEFMVRNDGSCGSTIGPIVSARLGMMTADVGVPQLSMHSIREMAGVRDIEHAISLFTGFFEDLPSIEISILEHDN